MNEYQLTEEEFKLVAEYQQNLTAIQQQLEGACKLIIRQQKLDGQWTLQGNKLVKVEVVNG
jgi:hypothetical protein